MSDTANKALITHFIQEIWNRNNLALLDELIDPAYYDYSYEPRNRQGLENILAAASAAFPGHETIIEEIVSEGDTVAVCQTFRGTHAGPFRGFPASGKSFEVGRYCFFKVVDGKIVSHRAVIDLPALLSQIGASA